MTLDEWIQKYNKKAVEPYAPLPSDFLFFDKEKGFLVLRPQSNEILWVYAVCGDGEHWNQLGMMVAKREGFKKVMAVTKHPPRFWKSRGWKQQAYIVEKEVPDDN